MQDKSNMSVYKQALRERILEASMNAFARKGIRAVRMDDIAKILGISKRTLYELYDNKELLLWECMQRYLEQKKENMKQMDAECMSVMDVILHIYRMKVEEWRNTNALFFSDIQKYPSVQALLRQDYEQNRKNFIGFMERGMKEGFFRKDLNWEVVAVMFDAITDSIMVNRLYEHYDVEQLFQNVLFVALRGVCTASGLQKLDEYFSALG